MNKFANILLVLALCYKAAYGDFFDICAGRDDGLLLKDYSACGRYFMCDSGIALPVTCPYGYNFDAEAGVCRPMAGVLCKECLKSDSYIERLPNTCSGYVRCFGGRIYYEQCPVGYLYDETYQHCRESDKVECVAERCRANESDEIFASKFDCAMYYTCVNGTATKTYCAAGQQFDSKQKRCESAKKVKCHIPVAVSTAEELPEMEIACPPTGVILYPHPLSCSSYFVCINGKSTTVPCGAELVYDINSKSCKSALDAKCIKSLI